MMMTNEAGKRAVSDGRRLHVVALIDRYLPIMGGAQNNVHLLLRNLADRGFHATVLTRRIHRTMPREETIDGVTVRRFGYATFRIASKMICGAAITGHLIRGRDRLDVVLSVPCAAFTDLLPAYLAGRMTDAPYVIRATSVRNFELMGPSSDSETWNTFERLVVPSAVWRHVFKRASAVVSQSSAVEEGARVHGLSDLHVIPNGVDTERFVPADSDTKRELRRELGLAEEKLVVVWTGRYERGKNQWVLIDAAKRIDASLRPDAIKLLLVGATEKGAVTSNEEELKGHVREHGLGDLVRFVDDASNVEDYLRASDVFVQPSHYPEGMPNSVLEAMACGLPVICSDLPQQRVMFPANSARFFDPMDADGLSDHLVDLIDSPELRRLYGASLRKLAVDRFSAGLVADRYGELLRSIVGSAP